MFKQLLFVLSVSIVLISCGKDDAAAPCVVSSNGVATAAEIAEVQAYLTSKSITATQDPSGLFYTITNPGSGSTANINSILTVRYRGSLENGTVFDSTNTTAGILVPMSNAIAGWQKGIPLIQKGGSINLYIPASLGYGCTAQTNIPAGSTLVFQIDLLNIQ